MKTESLSFAGSGGDELAARMDLPDGEPVAFALFAHCFTCSKDIAAATRISRGLVDQGFGVLRFDFTGLGASGGEFANTTFSSNVDDLVRAADALRGRYEAPGLLIGHSLGGAAVIVGAAAIPEVTAVATIGAPFDPGHISHLFPEETLARLRSEGEAEVVLAGRPFRIREEVLEDASAQNMTAALQDLRRALLVFHSPIDEVVGVDNARLIYEAARHPKSFVSLDGADHLLTKRDDSAYVATVLAAWARRYVPDPSPGAAPRSPEGGPRRPEGEVMVSDTGAGSFTQTVSVGHHTFTADEPPGIGSDLGPTPYDLLLAALGACTSMTLRMYADRKGWPLEGVVVRLRHDRVHAEDCAEADKGRCMVDNIDRDLDLAGPLTDDQRRQLLSIAERCPVHRTLTGDLRIATRLVPPGPRTDIGSDSF